VRAALFRWADRNVVGRRARRRRPGGASSPDADA